ncbi:uncharacterized protein AB675_3314 [Cyphellophora attinorum]|uniref:Uncharacterized protein n=1 Tax=Cyphellophora attinorum TaxID=1664694 RepID=A0A0N0NLU5_9EURO|nr:uncharacterized protein AB675_3314 [Phialophora attinorum]KPI39588.1 hypothetical protein AB675_3314 [Phialophora attinorum]
MPQRIATLLARQTRRALKRPSTSSSTSLQPSIPTCALLAHYHQSKPLRQNSVISSTPSELALTPRTRPTYSLLTLTLNLRKGTTTLRTFSSTTRNTNSIRTFSTTSQRFAAPPTADALVETLTDLYGTARDEFEIAAEETEKKTVYAADDRAAAREAFEELQSTYEGSLKEATPETAQEVQRRVGQRVRELEHALKGLEEAALHDD